MFSKKEQLLAKTGPDGVGRFDYLKQLVDEFNITQSYDAKQQILANLANFAYDPINYDYIRDLHIADLFLSQLSGNKDELLHYGLTGLCNLSSVGDSITIKRKITEDDLKRFAELSGDMNPVHFSSNSNKAIVHGAFLNSLVSGVIGTKLPGPGTLVISQNLNFPNKCFVDETIRVNVELVELRKLIKVKFICEIEEGDKVVMHGDAKLLWK
ncbi:armadillo repeat-containing protein 7 [Holotrichia oblita]|uniref:Armadillo repeat-containing protein 7 n=1 Tax=Holotrichia oblita TaxID=644536 RepID=A0ACB9TH55_HOLOL|nr:armadillo repeat-containing protein 7 [Holotrichia oblita]